MRRRGIGRPSVVGTMARTAVIAGTATAVSGSMSRHQQAKAQDAQQAAAYEEEQRQAELDAAVQQAVAAQTAAAAAAAPAAAPAPPGAPSVVDKLKELASLRDAGILSEEEFAAAKAKLLAG
jgi:Short C-terminal domain